MGKLAYFFTTFIGAVPAGFGLYLFIMNFLDRADSLGTTLMVICIIVTTCLALVALTPFMVLVFYKDTRPKLAAAGAAAVAAGAAAASGSRGEDGEGFGDAIPDDFDEDELRSSGGDDDFDDGGYDDDYGDDDYDDADYDDDFEDLDF